MQLLGNELDDAVTWIMDEVRRPTAFEAAFAELPASIS
jgi:hypothetical protein